MDSPKKHFQVKKVSDLFRSTDLVREYLLFVDLLLAIEGLKHSLFVNPAFVNIEFNKSQSHNFRAPFSSESGTLNSYGILS